MEHLVKVETDGVCCTFGDHRHCVQCCEPPTPVPTPVPTNFNHTLPAGKFETPAPTRAAKPVVWVVIGCVLGLVLGFKLASRAAEAARARKKNSLLGLSRQSRDPEYGSVPLTPVQVRSDVPVARPVEETMSEAGSATAAALEFERRAEERVPRGTSTPSAPPLSQLV